jgi:hypothetical protein
MTIYPLIWGSFECNVRLIDGLRSGEKGSTAAMTLFATKNRPQPPAEANK